MEQPIIVGVADADEARDAVAFGIDLARGLGAPLVVAGICVPVPGPAEVGHLDVARAQTERRLQDALQRVPPDVDASLIVRVARSPVQGLHELAEHRDAAALVPRPDAPRPRGASAPRRRRADRAARRAVRRGRRTRRLRGAGRLGAAHDRRRARRHAGGPRRARPRDRPRRAPGRAAAPDPRRARRAGRGLVAAARAGPGDGRRPRRGGDRRAPRGRGARARWPPARISTSSCSAPAPTARCSACCWAA